MKKEVNSYLQWFCIGVVILSVINRGVLMFIPGMIGIGVGGTAEKILSPVVIETTFAVEAKLQYRQNPRLAQQSKLKQYQQSEYGGFGLIVLGLGEKIDDAVEKLRAFVEVVRKSVKQFGGEKGRVQGEKIFSQTAEQRKLIELCQGRHGLFVFL